MSKPQTWRNRIVGLEQHKPSELLDHPFQWRTHPANQVNALRGVLEEVGIAGALVAWGALHDRKWTVPVAAAIAMPVLWLTAFATLAALPALGRRELQPVNATARRADPADATGAAIVQAAS